MNILIFIFIHFDKLAINILVLFMIIIFDFCLCSSSFVINITSGILSLFSNKHNWGFEKICIYLTPNTMMIKEK